MPLIESMLRERDHNRGLCAPPAVNATEPELPAEELTLPDPQEGPATGSEEA